ncbi:hypothetical protein NPIL_645021 [Nephila pilipes]|uniref:Uncharacterized protein n=1 Tax=Nephila pilipes TaxID=299642 RepID=A0A8X6N8M8_NEPPI|nr:hypothetical protein NPIL_654681 [Nephila pilipes]GFT40789.1 hypothetical protein NPIL_645021 [Nephila pilipes]
MSGSTSGTSFSDPASSLSALSSGDLAVIIFLISTCDREAKQKGVEEMSQNNSPLPCRLPNPQTPPQMKPKLQTEQEGTDGVFQHHPTRCSDKRDDILPS